MSKETDDELKGKVLYDLLFNRKVKKLGDLDVEQHSDYVVINGSKGEDNGKTKKSD
jgi:hypothetical protein